MKITIKFNNNNLQVSKNLKNEIDKFFHFKRFKDPIVKNKSKLLLFLLISLSSVRS